MKPVFFPAEAEAEFRPAIAYYEGQREGSAEFQADVERTARLPHSSFQRDPDL